MDKKSKSFDFPLSSFVFRAPLFQVLVAFSSIFHFPHRTFFLDYSIPVSSFFLPSFGSSLSSFSLVLFLFYFFLPGIVVASFCLLFFLYLVLSVSALFLTSQLLFLQFLLFYFHVLFLWLTTYHVFFCDICLLFQSYLYLPLTQDPAFSPVIWIKPCRTNQRWSKCAEDLPLHNCVLEPVLSSCVHHLMLGVGGIGWCRIMVFWNRI